MKHPTLSVDKDNINPKNIDSLAAGHKSVSINQQPTKPVDQIADEEIARLKRHMPSSH